MVYTLSIHVEQRSVPLTSMQKLEGRDERPVKVVPEHGDAVERVDG
jgi:hypothetical protein